MLPDDWGRGKEYRPVRLDLFVRRCWHVKRPRKGVGWGQMLLIGWRACGLQVAVYADIGSNISEAAVP